MQGITKLYKYSQAFVTHKEALANTDSMCPFFICKSDRSQISICISCCNVIWSPNVCVARIASVRYIECDTCKGMLNGAAGVREVKEATTDLPAFLIQVQETVCCQVGTYLFSIFRAFHSKV